MKDLILIILILTLKTNTYGQQASENDDRIVAKAGNYKITADEFMKDTNSVRIPVGRIPMIQLS